MRLRCSGELAAVGGLTLIATACALGGQEGEDFQDSGPGLATGPSSTDTSTGTGTGAGSSTTTGTGTGTGGGTGLLPGDVCPGAIAASTGTTSIDLGPFANDYSSYVCGVATLVGDGTTGADAVLAVEIPEGQTAVIAHDPAHPAVLAAYGSCDVTATGTCLGAIETPAGGPAGFTTSNDGDAPLVAHVFTDGYGAADGGPVDIRVETYDPAAGGETCDDALPIDADAARVAVGGGVSMLHSFGGYGGDLTMGPTGCTGAPATGSDVVFSIALAAGESLDATLTPLWPDADVALYLLVGDCSDAEDQCVGGSDAGGDGSPESVQGYVAPPGGAVVYLVADGRSPSAAFEAFTLDVTVQ